MKTYLLLSILLFNIGCAAITNTNKPELRDDKAIRSAYNNNVIERKDRYEYGNILMLVLIIPGIVGLLYDNDNNNYYVVSDPKSYEAWKIQYLELVEKRKNELLDTGLKNN